MRGCWLGLVLIACGGKAGESGESALWPGETDSSPPTESDSDSSPETLEILDVQVSDNPNSTLSALVRVQTSTEAEVRISFEAAGVEAALTRWSNPGTEHEIEVVGMYAETLYSLGVQAEASGESAEADPVEYTTGALPEGLPRMELPVVEPAQMQPAYTLFGAVGAGTGGGPPPPAGPPPPPKGEESPFLIGIDPVGEVVWYYELEDADASTFNDRDVRVMSDGNFLISTPSGFRVITPGGTTLREVSDATVGYAIHHDALQVGENLVVLVRDSRTVDVPSMGGDTELAGDGLLELDAQDEIVWEWWSFDHLDTTRFPDELSTSTAMGGDGLDWTHANGLHYEESSDSLLLSLRSQHQVVQIDHGSGEVGWILGADGDFSLDSGEWFNAQHAPELHEDGSVYLYDNGNTKATAYSRGVVYSLDTDAMVATESFAHATEFYTEFLGDHDRLANGNSLICAGGQNTDGLPAQLLEISPAGELVWQVNLPDSIVYRATRIESF